LGPGCVCTGGEPARPSQRSPHPGGRGLAHLESPPPQGHPGPAISRHRTGRNIRGDTAGLHRPVCRTTPPSSLQGRAYRPLGPLGRIPTRISVPPAPGFRSDTLSLHLGLDAPNRAGAGRQRAHRRGVSAHPHARCLCHGLVHSGGLEKGGDRGGRPRVRPGICPGPQPLLPLHHPVSGAPGPGPVVGCALLSRQLADRGFSIRSHLPGLARPARTRIFQGNPGLLHFRDNRPPPRVQARARAKVRAGKAEIAPSGGSGGSLHRAAAGNLFHLPGLLHTDTRLPSFPEQPFGLGALCRCS